MITTADILVRGYLPKELPPVFTSASLGAVYRSLAPPASKHSSCLRYSYSKYASVRRPLAIPNPAHFIALAEAVASNWAALDAHCKTSPLSWTKPKIDTKRALAWENTLDKLPELRAGLRVGARYALQADVSACYASTYTHAIPWALHSKATAKIDRSTHSSVGGAPPLYGNILDAASRNIQSGQTAGLPIGPDTSLPIAEAILTEVDKLVESGLAAKGTGFRFVDDYEFVFTTLAEAERARNTLQDALSEYELQLNPRKTRIITLPSTLETPWVQELASFPIDGNKPGRLKSQLIRYFSRAFELADRLPGDPVLKYAVRRLSEVDTTTVSELLQKLLFQTAAIDPGTLHTALYLTYLHRTKGAPVAVDHIARALSAIVVRHAPLHHGGDLAWALWGAVVFKLQLDDDAAIALEAAKDPIAILMAMFAETRSVFRRRLTKTQWDHHVGASELYDTRWLLAYESFGQGWMPHISIDPASTDPFFRSARANGVAFMDPTPRLEIPEPTPIGDASG